MWKYRGGILDLLLVPNNFSQDLITFSLWLIHSTCSLQELIDSDAFTIERHGLRISQPITAYEDISEDIDGVPDGVRLNCSLN